jgi:hypothetical protein
LEYFIENCSFVGLNMGFAILCMLWSGSTFVATVVFQEGNYAGAFILGLTSLFLALISAAEYISIEIRRSSR